MADFIQQDFLDLSGAAAVRCTQQLPVCTRCPRRFSAQVARRVWKWKLHRAEVCCTETQRQELRPKRITLELTDAESMIMTSHTYFISSGLTSRVDGWKATKCSWRSSCLVIRRFSWGVISVSLFSPCFSLLSKAGVTQVFERSDGKAR